jgi:hypothetical protein
MPHPVKAGLTLGWELRLASLPAKRENPTVTSELRPRAKTMLEISTAKVAHVIVRAREYDAKVASWEDPVDANFRDNTPDSVLESFADDATRSELAEFIGGLNEDEQASLVALAWIGRGSFAPDELSEAIATAKAEQVNRTEDYLMGMPLLADYLEEGLDKLGFSVEEAEEGVL